MRVQNISSQLQNSHSTRNNKDILETCTQAVVKKVKTKEKKGHVLIPQMFVSVTTYIFELCEQYK